MKLTKLRNMGNITTSLLCGFALTALSAAAYPAVQSDDDHEDHAHHEGHDHDGEHADHEGHGHAEEVHAFESDVHRAPSFQTGGNCLIENVTIHTAVSQPFVGSVWVQGGGIRAVIKSGADWPVAPDADLMVLDGTGKHLAPGVVDNHSHMAIERGINEGTLSITADVDISDSVNADDITIYRALAGGVTAARLLHGSANTIGGRHEVIKLRWGRTADELRVADAPEGIKFALGENVKRSNWGDANRFPATRPGVETILERAFTRASEYRDDWIEYEEAVDRGEQPVPLRKDLRLDTLAGILEGRVAVHSHCYRADEILMLMRSAESFGFTIKTLQHVLEGYKIAKEIADHGAGGSTFGDWWAYKIEAYDAVPQCAALMDEAGVLSSVNSDSDEMVRRLYGEAAKSVRYAGMDPVRALALVTINSAMQLDIGHRVGSIEVGKDADLVLMNGDPLSSRAKVLWTMVEGEVEFEARDDFGLEANPGEVADLKPATPLDTDLYEANDSEGADCVALVGGTLHPVTAPAIENGTLLMQGNRIVGMGDVVIPEGCRRIDVRGKHVWPGMIALGTSLGLFEIDAVRATMDVSEIGGNQPDVSVASSLNADSAHFEVTRAGGITRAQTGPESGGPVLGQSALARMTGDNWEELVFEERDMLHIRFPRTSNLADDKEEKSGRLETLEKLFNDASAYGELKRQAAAADRRGPAFDARLEAMLPYIAQPEGSEVEPRQVALWAQNAQTILFAMRFATEFELNAVLYGVREGWKVADVIAEAGFPVVVGPVLELPYSRYDPYSCVFSNAGVLQRAGVPFAIMAAERSNQRNLPFNAAMATAYGLPEEEAVRAVTYYPARILGWEDRVGSLEPGKLADVIVTPGHVLEITSPVELLFIEGVEQSLDTRQTRLYERYRARLQRQMAAAQDSETEGSGR